MRTPVSPGGARRGRPDRERSHQRAHPRRDRRRQGGAGRAGSTATRRARPGRSSASTARRSPRRCSRASCSATRRAPSPARSQTKPGLLESGRRRHGLPRRDRRDAAARCRPSSCACSRTARCTRVGGPGGAHDRRALRRRHQPRSRGRGGERRRFRQDLYFRLNGISLTIPPLRERPDEIEPLARRFLADAAARRRSGARPGCRAEALELLAATPGPATSASCATSSSARWCCATDGEITPEHLPARQAAASHAWPRRPARPPGGAGARASRQRPPTPPDRPDPGGDAERQRILELLAEYGGNQTRVAKKLGMARGTLIERLKRYGIKRPQVDD